ncbi:DUF697 domain-containing protein [Desulfococcaceae bacterium HSG8]|nr:DUF697 domain-containing protein [Desulfococcaceae bacterium HSG8]
MEKEKTEIDVSEEDENGIVRNYVTKSVEMRLVPVALADFEALTGIHVNMLKRLAKTYSIPFPEDRAKDLIASLIETSVMLTIKKPISDSLSERDRIARVLNSPVFIEATTYAVGKTFARHFASGGTFQDFDPEKSEKYYTEMLDEGKEEVPALKSDSEEIL